MLKILQARLQQYVNREIPDVQAGFRKGQGTRDHIKKIRATKGTFHAKTGSIEDRNDTDLTEAEDIKKRWQVLIRWMKLEPIIQSEVSQKEKHQYSILTHIYGI